MWECFSEEDCWREKPGTLFSGADGQRSPAEFIGAASTGAARRGPITTTEHAWSGVCRACILKIMNAYAIGH